MTATANNTRTPATKPVLDIFLVTASKGNVNVGTAMIAAPSQLERVWSAGTTKGSKDGIALAALAAISDKLVGNSYEKEVVLHTSNKYLVKMFGGEYKRMRLAGEEIQNNDLWKKIITNLTAHKCHLTVGEFFDCEQVERCKATATYYAKEIAAETTATETAPAAATETAASAEEAVA